MTDHPTEPDLPGEHDTADEVVSKDDPETVPFVDDLDDDDRAEVNRPNLD